MKDDRNNDRLEPRSWDDKWTGAPFRERVGNSVAFSYRPQQNMFTAVGSSLRFNYNVSAERIIYVNINIPPAIRVHADCAGKTSNVIV